MCFYPDPAKRNPMQNGKYSKTRRPPAALTIAFLFGYSLMAQAANPSHESQEEYRAAIIEIQNLLQTNPNDAEARRRLGLVNLEWGHGPEAEKELRRAIEFSAFPESLLIPLLESLLMQGKYQEALDEKLPLALLSADHQATLLAYRGEAWLGLYRPDKAEEEFGRALQMSPESVATKLGQARLAQTRQQFDVAGRLLAEVLAVEPNNPKAWSLQGGLFEATKQWDKAEDSYSKAIALKRFGPVERASRAMLRINTDRLEAAQADLDVLKREAPNFFLTLYTEGLMSLRMDLFGEAQLSLERALKQNDRFNSINYYLGIAHYYQGHDREAQKYLEAFSAYSPEIVEARVFLASLQFRRGDHEEARALLKTVLVEQPNNLPALKLMSDIEVLGGNHEQGLQYLRKFSELDRQRKQARKGQTAEPTDPADRIDVLAEMEGNSGVIDPKLARTVSTEVLQHLRAGKFAEAQAVIHKLAAKAPENPLTDHLAGLVYLAQNDPAKAKSAFRAALAKKPGDPVLTHRLAQLELRSRNAAMARRLYEQALERDPGNLSLRMHLAELDGQEGKVKEMQDRLIEVIQDHPTDLEPRVTLATQMLKSGQAGRAQALLEELRDGYPRNPTLTILLIKAQLENHQVKQALATAQGFVAAEPRSAMAHYLLAMAYAENQDPARSREALEKAMSTDRNFLPARHSYIRQRVGQGDFEHADRELRSLAEEYPEDVQVMLLRCWVASAERRFPEAVQACEAAWKRSKTSDTVIALAKATWLAGDHRAALNLLERWIDAHPQDALVRIAAGDFYMAEHQTAAAIRHLERVLREHPDNILVMNNLAWLYRETAPDKALGAARRAASLAPHAPDVLDTLAMIELDRGDAAKAVELLTHAAELAPGKKLVRYHLALALEKAGKRQEAARWLKDVLADPRGFPERREAQALLDKVSAN